MPRPLCCRFCRADLDPAQEFAYLVELQTVNDPVMLAAIRRLPHAGGKPLRVCRACQSAVAGRRPGSAPAGKQAVVTAIAAVGLVAITATLGRWLSDAIG